jgi:hypothetical protein
VVGRGHGRRLRSGPGESVQQAAASALVPVPAVCESCYLELDRGIRFRRLSAIYLSTGRRRTGGHHNTSAGIGLQQEQDGASRIETGQGCVVAHALALAGGGLLLSVAWFSFSNSSSNSTM